MIETEFLRTVHDFHGRVADLPQAPRRRQGMVEIADGILNPARSLDDPQAGGGQSTHSDGADPLMDSHQGHRDDDAHRRRHTRGSSNGHVPASFGRALGDLGVETGHLGHPVVLAAVPDHLGGAEDRVRDVRGKFATQAKDLMGGVQARSCPDDE